MIKKQMAEFARKAACSQAHKALYTIEIPTFHSVKRMLRGDLIPLDISIDRFAAMIVQILKGQDPALTHQEGSTEKS